MRVQSKLRLRSVLHARIKAAAKRNRRSLNAEIEARLEASLWSDNLADAVRVAMKPLSESTQELEKQLRHLASKLQQSGTRRL